MTDQSFPPSRGPSRNVVIAGSVVLFHVALLWAIQSGLVRRAVEVIVPVQVLSEIITPPAPKTEIPVQPPAPPKEPVLRKIQPVIQPAPQPVAIPDPTPAPNAPTGVVAPQPPAPPIQAPVAVAAPPAAPAAPPAPPRVEMPSSDAAYLNNPLPNYPAVSRRLGEQGKVVVRVFIGVDGLPQRAELSRSSGFDRLDNAALDYVMKCRYVPGKVGGTPQAMWYSAPVNFVLN
jgi:protein TonB